MGPIAETPQREQPNIPAVDAERKHLEGLLKDRTNFYLVFASVFILGAVTRPTKDTRWILLFGTAASILIALAVWRTHRLVGMALGEITSFDRDHPYSRYKKDVCFPPDANKLMIGVPFLLTGLFVYLTCRAFGWP